MVFRDVITQVVRETESDGMGGTVSKNPRPVNIECKASLNTSPEVSTAYGLAGEQVLYVVTHQELDKGALYLYKNKKYSLRFQTNNNRLFFSTLIEIKGGRKNV